MKNSKLEMLIVYYGSFIWTIFNFTIMLRGSFSFKGAYLEGASLYGFIIAIDLIILYQLYDMVKYMIKSNNSLTLNIITREFITSPFFIMYVVVFMYQNYSFNYYNRFLLMALYVPFFYFQYKLLKKIENYGSETKK